jgi:hypothetical protein
MANTVIIVDKGYAGIEKRALALNDAHSRCGFPVGTSPKSPTQTGSGRTPFHDMLDLVQVVIWNEFGTMKNGKPKIPERPAVRQAFDANLDDIIKFCSVNYDLYSLGQIKVDELLNRIGLYMVSLIKNSIRDFDTPPNAAYTEWKKGFNNPLIDTGQMIQSVQHIIEFRKI